MTIQRTLEIRGIVPCLSSQTISTWPLVMQEENVQIMGQSLGYDVSNPPIRALREKTWDEVMEEVLAEYSDAWERLASL